MRDLSRPGRSAVHARNGMAATSHPLATQTAIQILRDGGNAMDAAIAACAVQCVVEPGSTGIGGDCFCLFAPGGSTDIVAYNGSGRAPAAAKPAFFQSSGLSSIERYSPHAVTIPGAVDAWIRLSADHGRLDFAALLAPAIEFARDGFPVSSRVHADYAASTAVLRGDPVSAAHYLVSGEAPGVGTVHRLPKLAGALEAIAENGRDVFYSGWIADDMIERLQALGGLHTPEDFASAAGEYVSPISGSFRDRTVHECPPNGQGVIALVLLNMMQMLDIDPGGPLTVDRIHLEIEAAKMAYRARNLFVGDPAFGDVPVDDLLSEGFARDLVAKIDTEKATVPQSDMTLPRHRDTVYISVVDKDRNACSFINTLFGAFGSGITAPRSGVLLHNRGQGFVLEPGHPNCIAPGKRPLHTIIPAIASNKDRTEMSFGVMGGHYQALGHMQFLTRHLDFGMDLQEAMDLPRFMVDPDSTNVDMESGIGDEIVTELEKRGHVINRPIMPIGGSQAISIDWEQNVLTGASDPRKDGCAIGY
ncbi:MAG: gamma-glutamyltransferase [Alphaproteobacteria bacterium]|nr:gamma-glutamyltransferase [Alphaproteobacteria bacterium]